MHEMNGLKGRKVLVVEDEMMIAMLVEDMLADMGCEVIGPAHNLSGALEVVTTSDPIDAALLDVNLGGHPVFAVADALRSRNVPIVFCTGYGDAGLREADRGSPVLQKPYRASELADALAAALKVS
ncbi:MAG TPA: response regulator [Caulobacteraceae bacterium]|jgi:CheY-like chemotaxis protein|nr:response regulator [Caulobacteraceae bacterium]